MGRKHPVKMPSAVRLDVAYDDLTREAYAVWIRMMIEPDHDLEQLGMFKLAEKFKYSKRQFFNIVRQLRNKGYIRFTTPPPGVPVSIYVTKRPLLVGFDRFVKLS